jgi:hypothetical protein
VCRSYPSERRTPAIGLAAGVLILILTSAACHSGGGAARNPGSPTPVADPESGPGTLSPPQADPAGSGAAGPPAGRGVPVRPDQAPLVGIRDALETDSLLGRRVRVAGRCTAAGAGRRAGSWTLTEEELSIEVRGLVPSSCNPASTTDLRIFAQIEPKAAGSTERLLLRLPD